MLLRLKLKSGGKINLVAASVSHFDEAEGGSKVTMNNGFAFDVEESAQSIRHQYKKLASASEPVTEA